jgi:hypothetical protein
VTKKKRGKRETRAACELREKRSRAAKKAAATRARNARERSRRAKKGWETRRKNTELDRQVRKNKNARNVLAAVAKPVKGKKRKPPKTPAPAKKPKKTPKLTNREKDAEIERLKSENAALETKLSQMIDTSTWVPAVEIEYLRRDGSIALHSSGARHLGELTDEILKDLKRARKAGEYALRFAATQWSDRLDLPLREIYTLFYSP